MPKRSTVRDDRMRQRLTLEAARIMAEEEVGDYAAAKRKAAQRLGAPDTRNLPTNREIQTALMDYQRLFFGDDQRQRVRSLRSQAIGAMEFLGRFRPRLVGSVLNGTAGPNSDVNLHLFADAPEEVVVFLLDHEIPFQTSERRLRFGNEQYLSFPVYRFVKDNIVFDLTVFSGDGLREAPRSRVDGQPMERATMTMVRNLLEV